MELTHVSAQGVKMVDVSGKEEMKRKAKAGGKIKLKKETIEKIKLGRAEKGNVLAAAQVGATLAVKKTSELIPMCHSLPVTGVEVDFRFNEDEIEAIVTVTAVAKTGVEMEALVGATAALLTIWDMVKALEKDERGQYPGTRISDVRVIEKIKER